jgi:hypothetical protein
MIAMTETTSKPKALNALIGKAQAGYTIRRGVYIPRRGFPRWQFQLFTPTGEFERVIDRRLMDRMDAVGLNMFSHENGVTRHQEVTQ